MEDPMLDRIYLNFTLYHCSPPLTSTSTVNSINFRSRKREASAPTEMTTSAAKMQEIYNQQGFLSALPVLNETELREAKHAFSELEGKFGKCHWKMKEEAEGRGEKGRELDRKKG